MWLHVSIITLTGLICSSTGSHSARYQTIGWAKCLDADVVFESLRHVTFLQCLHECWVRLYCRGVNFWWRLQTCQVVHDDSGAIVHTGDGSCAFVHQTDIFNLSMIPGGCSPCPEYHACDVNGNCIVKACPKLFIDDAIVYGNVRTFGAKAKVVCQHGATSGPDSAQAVCQQDGTWSLGATVCRKYCEILPPTKANSTITHIMVGSDATASYSCDSGFVVEFSGNTTSSSTHTAICNGTTSSWLGLNFQCVSVCPVTILPPLDSCPCVQVSDITLLVCSASMVDQTTAATNCQAVGSLARLDTPAKMSALQDYLNVRPEYNGVDLWVQGRYDGSDWRFSNGDLMPTDSSMWYDADGSRPCVKLRSSDNFQLDDRNCSHTYSYVCELS